MSHSRLSSGREPSLPPLSWHGAFRREVRSDIVAADGSCAHAAGRRLPTLVPGRGGQGATGRERPGPRHDDHPPMGLRHLGALAAWPRRPHQGQRRAQRLLPPADSPELPYAERQSTSRASAPSWRSSPSAAVRSWLSRPSCGRRRRRSSTPHLRAGSRATATSRSRSISGRTSCQRNSEVRRNRRGRSSHRTGGPHVRPGDPRGRLCRDDGAGSRDPGLARAQDRAREVRRCRRLLVMRGTDAGRQGATDGHFARAGTELCARLRHRLYR
jgi:hypothetical protein